ncbi:PaaI family thioesterase [Marinobacter caseinilyticus]|uniref:PaaI family thioesterase n=1 Tax=Marinobacter caseinilyticus TaxID=2692195 RepID=UPI00140A1CE0|nr:PaaI family thioesterase [Marinobacter caseinilyticus]
MTVTVDELRAFLAEQFPQGERYGTLQSLGDGWAEMVLEVTEEHLRPGGTVSGPAMMGLADVALYAALLSRIGLVPLAVTSNLNINFLRKPVAHTDITARATLLRVGRTMGVGEVLVHSVGMADPVAQATITYAIPRPR